MKFENIAQIGDRIRGYDFQSIKESFIEGPVVAKGWIEKDGQKLFKAFTIQIERDGQSSEYNAGREGDLGYIPFETTFDYDNRVEVV